MAREDNVIVPRWFLENVEGTLRIQNNINLDKTTGETCQDRNIRESLNGLRKLLKGDELSGMERLEKLQPPLPSNLDEAARKYGFEEYRRRCEGGEYGTSEDAFKAGAEWAARQGIKLHGRILPGPKCNLYIESDCFDRGHKGLNYSFSDSNDVDMFVQIRKK